MQILCKNRKLSYIKKISAINATSKQAIETLEQNL